MQMLRSSLTALLAVGVTAAFACGGDKSAPDSAAAATSKGATLCSASASSPTTLATRAYIKGTDPTPQYFLSAAGTDSGMPEDALKVLQDKGPTYFYAGSEAARKKVRDKLDANGPYTSLLVVFRGQNTETDGSRTIKLGGHYIFINGKPDPKSAPERTFRVACEEPEWKLVGEPAEKPK